VPAPIDYLNPQLPAGLKRVPIPVVDATSEALLPFGRLIADPEECRIEIVRWPAQGSRPVDADTGDQGGTTEGVFVSEWQGDILYGRNEAVATTSWAMPSLPSWRAATTPTHRAA